MTDSHFDVAVIGAGIAGLTCAQELHQAGQRVIVLEKSRGVGGRIATRRLHNTHADHGTCYLSPKGDRFRQFLDRLLTAGVIQVWTDSVHQVDGAGLQAEADRVPRYVAPAGMTAIAKALAPGLEIRFGQRVVSVQPIDPGWKLTAELINSSETIELTAKALVVAIPAPQAVDLLQPIAPADFLTALKSVEFFPSLSVMAGYGSDRASDWNQHYPGVKAVTFRSPLTPALRAANARNKGGTDLLVPLPNEQTDLIAPLFKGDLGGSEALATHAQSPQASSVLGYVGLDSSKRSQPSDPTVFVIQSSAEFAEGYLDAIDLQPAAAQLLQAVAQQFLPWFASPDWMQIHRWRYAFAKNPIDDRCLVASTDAPLVCAGDWCGGRKVEDGFLSGLIAAEHLLIRSR